MKPRASLRLTASCPPHLRQDAAFPPCGPAPHSSLASAVAPLVEPAEEGDWTGGAAWICAALKMKALSH